VTLVGDALHTVHFSTAMGTQLAIEDAIALWRAFEATRSVPDALRAYEAARRPAVERAQEVSAQSLAWFEDLDCAASLTPATLAEAVVRVTRRIEPAALQALEIAEA
jgi:anthraniloyl-CoA monooxygenase